MKEGKVSGARLVEEMSGTTRIFGRDQKVSVVFSGKKASSKSGLVILPDITNSMITPKQSSLMRGFVDQESGYIKHSNLKRIDSMAEANPMKAAALRGIEDSRVCRLRMGEYMGSKFNMTELVDSTAKSFRKNFDASNYENWKNTLPFAFSLLGRELKGIEADLSGIEDKLPKETMEVFRKYEERIKTTTSFEESLALVEEILGPEDSKEPEPKPEEGDGDEDSESRRESEGAYNDMQNATADQIEQLKLSIKENHGKDVYEIDPHFYASDAYNITNIAPPRNSAEEKVIWEMATISHSAYRSAVTGEIAKTVGAARKKLEYLLFSKIDRAWNTAQPEGRLDSKRIASVPTGNSLVFKTKAPRKEVDTAVMVLVDLSGSMQGTKARIAQECSLVFGECLNMCQVNFSIYAFNTIGHGYQFDSEQDLHPIHRAALSPNGLKSVMKYKGERSSDSNLLHLVEHQCRRWHGEHIYVYKRFKDKFLQVRRSVLAMTKHTGGSNYDCAGLHHAYHELRKQPERKKVMFVLSDGQPASICESYEPTMQKIIEIEADRDIILYGIGIQHNTAEMYKNAVVVNNVSDLGQKCFETLAKQVKG
jgi:hypothetical protein